ncbi:MAG TPA: multiheme c-type cytochrome [Vicinamibacterales bacterium]|nr:multiheme c-type cytochrome [Vicinamibacterales bacterium]
MTAVLSYVIYAAADLPHRGYTSIGYLLGTGAGLAILLALLYSWRKRAGQEVTPGKLTTWLAIHVWISVLAVWLALVHSGFHLDGGWGTWALVFLVVAVAAGIGGLGIYVWLPPRVPAQSGNLASKDTERAIKDTTARIEESAAGRSAAFKAAVGSALAGTLAEEPAVDAGERASWEATRTLLATRVDLVHRLERQQRLHRTLRVWLLVHIPVSCLFVAALFVHIVDATDLRWHVMPPGPKDFQDPATCASCHQQQYQEWLGSMHAIAMSSPVTELQNRLVLIKEQRDRADGKATPEVGDLCVRCHAPTSRLGSARSQEDPSAALPERASASAFGVSCVACHLVVDLTAKPDHNGVQFKNIENVSWAPGLKTMFGSFGQRAGDPPPVGNAGHRSEGRDFYVQARDSTRQSEFCATCHTVAVDLPGGEKTLTLQDTFREWEAGSTIGGLNWKQQGLGCLDCHGQDLTGVASLAAQLAQRDATGNSEPLAGRLEKVTAALQALTLPASDRLAADPAGRVDGPLPERRQRRHTFTGVDYHLESALPFAADSAGATGDSAIQRETIARVQSLHRIAAAIRISGLSGSDLQVDVMNLASGHQLPTGFAFAREMWIEVAVADPRPQFADGFRVIVGGRTDGLPLGSSDSLDKQQPGLRNFQAVLFDEVGGREVVLQNEATTVLKGEAANRAGFTDREPPLQPGEIRSLRIALPEEVADSTPVRVRLRFRNLPPEFIEGIAAKFDEIGDAARAARTRALVDHLQIFDMAGDTLPPRGSE